MSHVLCTYHTSYDTMVSLSKIKRDVSYEGIILEYNNNMASYKQ